jgi:hypothetical protein
MACRPVKRNYVDSITGSANGNAYIMFDTTPLKDTQIAFSVGGGKKRRKMREDMMRMPFLSNDDSGAVLASVLRDNKGGTYESQATSSHSGAVATDSLVSDAVINPKLINISCFENKIGIAYADLGPTSCEEYKATLGLDADRLSCGFEQFGVHKDSSGRFLTEDECHDRQLLDKRLLPTNNTWHSWLNDYTNYDGMLIHELCSLDQANCNAAKVYPDFTTNERKVLNWFKTSPNDSRYDLSKRLHHIAKEITLDLRHGASVIGRNGCNLKTSPHGLASVRDYVDYKANLRPDWELTMGVLLSILYWDLFGKDKAAEERQAHKGKGKGVEPKINKGRLQFTRALWRHPKYIDPCLDSVYTLENGSVAQADQEPRDQPSEIWAAKHRQFGERHWVTTGIVHVRILFGGSEATNIDPSMIAWPFTPRMAEAFGLGELYHQTKLQSLSSIWTNELDGGERTGSMHASTPHFDKRSAAMQSGADGSNVIIHTSAPGVADMAWRNGGKVAFIDLNATVTVCEKISMQEYCTKVTL